MTPTPNAVERYKAVPTVYRSLRGRVATRVFDHRWLYTEVLWSAFDTLLADNARMRSEIVRSHTALHGEMSSVGSGECECEWCKETR